MACQTSTANGPPRRRRGIPPHRPAARVGERQLPHPGRESAQPEDLSGGLTTTSPTQDEATAELTDAQKDEPTTVVNGVVPKLIRHDLPRRAGHLAPCPADRRDQLGDGVLGDRLPMKTDGGLMSFSHLGWGGLTLKVVEAVRQLRGEAGDLQVAEAEVALLTGAGLRGSISQRHVAG
jgi:hypothetical protein